MHRENRSVGELAYQLWQARGCPEGTAEQDWLDAERQLRTSDRPATQGPDQPPTNKEAKSKAAGVSRKESNRRSTRAPLKKGDASSTDQRK
jgi:hypothetical protein